MRATIALRLVVPALWLGLIVGLSLIEAPLKFLAPGITIELGLGIGRLVFIALAIAGWILLVVVTFTAVPAPRVGRSGWAMIAAMWVVLAVQTFVIRPPLNARSDIIIAGGDPGESVLHYVYIATDAALIILLLVWIIAVGRRIPVAEVGVGEQPPGPRLDQGTEDASHGR